VSEEAATGGRPTVTEALAAVSAAEVIQGAVAKRVEIQVMATGEVVFRLFPTGEPEDSYGGIATAETQGGKK
jgi:hypothetical protein